MSVTTGGDVKTPVKYFVSVAVAGGGAGATAADMAYPRYGAISRTCTGELELRKSTALERKINFCLDSAVFQLSPWKDEKDYCKEKSVLGIQEQQV